MDHVTEFVFSGQRLLTVVFVEIQILFFVLHSSSLQMKVTELTYMLHMAQGCLTFVSVCMCL